MLTLYPILHLTRLKSVAVTFSAFVMCVCKVIRLFPRLRIVHAGYRCEPGFKSG